MVPKVSGREALLFAAAEPVDEEALVKRLPPGTDVRASLKRLALEYAPRGVNLVRVGNAWAFRTANDLAWILSHEAVEPRKLSHAAIETLAIVAYHQPVTRAEIEEIRGVAVAKGTLDVLLETGWIRPRGRRKAPGPLSSEAIHRNLYLKIGQISVIRSPTISASVATWGSSSL